MKLHQRTVSDKHPLMHRDDP